MDIQQPCRFKQELCSPLRCRTLSLPCVKALAQLTALQASRAQDLQVKIIPGLSRQGWASARSQHTDTLPPLDDLSQLQAAAADDLSQLQAAAGLDCSRK